MNRFERDILPKAMVYARRLRAKRLSKAIGNATFQLLTGVVVLAGVDYVWALSSTVRGVLFGFLAGAAFGWPAILFWRWVRPLSPVEAAAELERGGDLPTESVTTLAWQHVRPLRGVSEELLDASAARVLAQLASAKLKEVQGVARVWWRIAILGVVLVVTLVLMGPRGMRLGQAGVRVVAFWSKLPAVRGLRVKAEPGNVKIEQGKGLVVNASVEGVKGDVGPVVLEMSRGGGTWGGVAMSPRGSGIYSATVPTIQRDLQYRVVVGDQDAIDGPYKVTVITKPVVRQRVPDRVRAGTLWKLSLSATEDLASGEVVGEGFTVPLEVAGLNATANMPPMPGGNHQLTLRLLAKHGGIGEEKLLLTVLPDTPPTIEIISPHEGAAIGPRDELEVVIRAEDDAGLGTVGVEAKAGSRTQWIPATLGSSTREQGRVRVSIANLGASPGDVMILEAIAHDQAGQVGRSSVVTLRVSNSAPDALAASRVRILNLATERARAVRASLAKCANDLLAASKSPAGEKQDFLTDDVRAGLAEVSEYSALLQRALCRSARVSGGPVFGDAIEGIVDRAVGPGALAEETLPLIMEAGNEDFARYAADIRRTVGVMSRIESALDTLRRAESAALVLAGSGVEGIDEDLVKKPKPELEAIVQRGREEQAKWKAPNFATVARQDANSGGPLSERLDAAWRVEALRPDALIRRAADLAIAARAAAVLATDEEPATDDFPHMLEDLGTYHVALREGRVSSEIERSAREARAGLEAMAGPLGRTVETLVELAAAPAARREQTLISLPELTGLFDDSAIGPSPARARATLAQRSLIPATQAVSEVPAEYRAAVSAYLERIGKSEGSKP